MDPCSACVLTGGFRRWGQRRYRGLHGVTVKLKTVPVDIFDPGAGDWLTIVPDGAAEETGEAGALGGGPALGAAAGGAGGAWTFTSPMVNPAALI